MNKKSISWILILVACLAIAGYFIWSHYYATTQVALVNFQPFQSSAIMRSNENPHVRYRTYSKDEYAQSLRGHDLVLMFGMGLRMTEEERAEIEQYAEKHPLLVFNATTPEMQICSLDSIQEDQMLKYLRYGNKKSFRSMANYIRKYIDQHKRSGIIEPDSVTPSPDDVFYHIDEEVAIDNRAEFEAYLRKIGMYHEGAPRIAITGGINDPYSGNKANLDSLIVALDRKGLNVYPLLAGGAKRFELLDELAPDAVIHFAHGRFSWGDGSETELFFQKHNTPLFSPLTMLTSREKWLSDPMGMMGGFLSQSIAMPEVDGAIYPYVLNTHELDQEGIVSSVADPLRLTRFSQIVANVIALRTLPNKDKRVAIYYFKGPGQSGLSAQGIEVAPSLYQLLKAMKGEGYTINLPADEATFEKLLMKEGPIFAAYTKGAIDEFFKKGHPKLITAQELDQWMKKYLTPEKYQETLQQYGPLPGEYMTTLDDKGNALLGLSVVDLGNVVLLPQPLAGIGSEEDHFEITHGAETAPPYPYIAAYLWAKEQFKADAMMHFGTHGSLEFTPQKQVALSEYDWADALVGTTPHYYYYTIGNIGESVMAKRRSYGQTISYITPPYENSRMRTAFKQLNDALLAYRKAEGSAEKQQYNLQVKAETIKMGLHRDLRLDSIAQKPYSEEEILKIENFAEEIANEKIYGTLYTTGIRYPEEKLRATVLEIASDPIAYSRLTLDRLAGKVKGKEAEEGAFVTRQYLEPAKELVRKILSGLEPDSLFIARYGGFSLAELREATAYTHTPKTAMMMVAGAESKAKITHSATTAEVKGGHPTGKPMAATSQEGKHPNGKTMGERPTRKEYSDEEKARFDAMLELAQTIKDVKKYYNAIFESPQLEIKAILNALQGGYNLPSSGGDAIANPQAVPTGRNLYSINAENTPSPLAWDRGKKLAEATIKAYYKKHGRYPQKVSYTFWSSEFIETEGATIAQVLYMMGVEPVRNRMGRVNDVRLIPLEDLGRPRIDVVIQTSGQFRDIAASRLDLITKAVRLAANASDGKPEENYVRQGAQNIEQTLVAEGVSPSEARHLSTSRVFGGLNGMYGTGIQEMIRAGGSWDDRGEIAEVYLHNMGASYASTEEWGAVSKGLFRAALAHTDVLIQPRQSNSWGALSLDHVFEFMGGLNATIAHVTGKDPEAYFADYRNRNNMRMQELKEAVGVESRSTLLNPYFVQEVVRGGSSSAMRIAENIENTYGWEMTRPEVIDDELWNELYDVWVMDSTKAGVQEFMRTASPAAMEQITAVMLETIRKGNWTATPEQMANLSRIHAEIVRDFGASGAAMTADNEKLRQFITDQLPKSEQKSFKRAMQEMRHAGDSKEKETSSSVVLQEDKSMQQEGIERSNDTPLSNLSSTTLWYLLAGGLAIILLLILLTVRRRFR